MRTICPVLRFDMPKVSLVGALPLVTPSAFFNALGAIAKMEGARFKMNIAVTV
jgi:hypothetical protein